MTRRETELNSIMKMIPLAKQSKAKQSKYHADNPDNRNICLDKA